MLDEQTFQDQGQQTPDVSQFDVFANREPSPESTMPSTTGFKLRVSMSANAAMRRYFEGRPVRDYDGA